MHVSGIRGLISVTDIAFLCSRRVAVITDIAVIRTKRLRKENDTQIYKLDQRFRMKTQIASSVPAIQSVLQLRSLPISAYVYVGAVSVLCNCFSSTICIT